MMVLSGQNKSNQKNPSMDKVASISDPDLLWIQKPDQSELAYGCDQDWYQSHWQRQAGCGPCTAATILYYLSVTHSDFSALFPYHTFHYDTMSQYMHEIWHFVTPGIKGVNDASLLVNGINQYAKYHTIELDARVFIIPAKPKKRPPFHAWFESIKQGLNQDSPVAFLNLSRGHLKNLDGWHWVTVTALFQKDEQVAAEISDSGERKIIDLTKWYQTTRMGGATAYFYPGK